VLNNDDRRRPKLDRAVKLANDGVDTRALQHFLGHRNIMHTVKYTELGADRFNHLIRRPSFSGSVLRSIAMLSGKFRSNFCMLA
jgi:hypothetical protein